MNLADEYALIKHEIENLESRLDQVKKSIKATGKSEIDGSFAVVTVALSERASLDQGMVRSFLSDNELKAATKITLVETIRYKSKPRMAFAGRAA